MKSTFSTLDKCGALAIAASTALAIAVPVLSDMKRAAEETTNAIPTSCSRLEQNGNHRTAEQCRIQRWEAKARWLDAKRAAADAASETASYERSDRDATHGRRSLAQPGF